MFRLPILVDSVTTVNLCDHIRHTERADIITRSNTSGSCILCSRESDLLLISSKYQCRSISVSDLTQAADPGIDLGADLHGRLILLMEMKGGFE